MAAYARAPVARSAGGWVVAGNTATLAAIISFPPMAGGAGGTVTHVGVGSGAAGATELDFFMACTPNLLVGAGTTPKLDTGTVITQAVDAMSDAAATAFLKLFFQNVAWANVGNAGGLPASTAAGNLYLSLHTASPGEGGNQGSNEMTYT